VRVCCGTAARVVRAVTVQVGLPDTLCAGTQQGYYGAANDSVTCTPCQQGPALSASLCGTGLGVPTYCCFRPTVLWSAQSDAGAVPQAATVRSYPYLSLPVPVR
jgi:hypothetical protein